MDDGVEEPLLRVRVEAPHPPAHGRHCSCDHMQAFRAPSSGPLLAPKPSSGLRISWNGAASPLPCALSTPVSCSSQSDHNPHNHQITEVTVLPAQKPPLLIAPRACASPRCPPGARRAPARPSAPASPLPEARSPSSQASSPASCAPHGRLSSGAAVSLHGVAWPVLHLPATGLEPLRLETPSFPNSRIPAPYLASHGQL